VTEHAKDAARRAGAGRDGAGAADAGKRRRAFSQASSLTAAWLLMLQNPQATGLGGVCLFDSGSPQFVPGTRMIVSTTSKANGGCHAITRTTGSTRRQPGSSSAST
jgi:hypothetical protein